LADITVLIADDHPLYRAGVRQVIEGCGTMEIVAEAGDGPSALKAIEERRPDLAVLDIRMPGMTGLQVVREMHRRNLTTDVICLTMYDDEETFNEAMDLGVMGYVSKESAVDDVVAAIETVARGRHYISPSLMDLMVGRRNRRSTGDLPLDTLSPMERKVLKRIAESRTSKEIAEELFISQRTVENHRAHISAKLGVHGAYSLLKFALENRSKL
jgi:DNA-binding NarL/FixJ family response regulator